MSPILSVTIFIRALVLDIETASPFEKPGRDDNDIRFYQWIFIGLACRDGTLEDKDTAVLFRRGGWEAEHIAGLFRSMIDWCRRWDIEQTLTYNGAYLYLRHLLKQADELRVRRNHCSHGGFENILSRSYRPREGGHSTS